MAEIISANFALAMGYFLVALFIVWGWTRILDWLLGVKFSDDVWPKIKDGNMAVAVYRIGWLWGCVWLAGKFIAP